MVVSFSTLAWLSKAPVAVIRRSERVVRSRSRQRRLDSELGRGAWYAPSVRRAKVILNAVGICAIAIGVMLLPLPHTNPKALTQSLFVWVAMTGAFTRPGVILILVGLGCLAVAALLPSGRE